MTVAPNPYEDQDGCIHGLGPISACVLCNGRAEKERKEADRIVTTFECIWGGTCAICNQTIDIGGMMSKTADGRYICGDGVHRG